METKFLYLINKTKRSLNKTPKGKAFVLSATFRHTVVCAVFVLFLLTLYHFYVRTTLTLDVKLGYKTRCFRTGHIRIFDGCGALEWFEWCL
jgi:hypothetical protein